MKEKKLIKIREKAKKCGMCYNARLSEFLTDNNDYSAMSIGNCFGDYRILLCSGNGQPLRIEFDRWVSQHGCWCTACVYEPKFCPECGRKIIEYD